MLAGLVAFALPTASAFGEGSVDLNTGPGSATRQGLVMSTVVGGGVATNHTIFYVYAQAGETIQLGSSATAGSSNILVYAPGTNLDGAAFPSGPEYGTDIFDCDTDAPAGAGVIPVGAAGRAQELAGPQPSPGGYVPCEFDVTTTGLYPVVMMPPAAPTGGGTTGTVDVPVQGTGNTIAIWDITVRDAGDVVQPGRAFAYHFTLVTSAGAASGAEVFPYTKTGYEYQVNFFDQGGVNWILRSDDMGVVDATTGERTFASFACGNDLPTNNACQFSNAEVAPPNRRYPLFLNRADPLVISGPGGLGETRGFATAPIAPSTNPLANAAFTGSGGQAGGTNRGSGGTIAFNSPTQMEGSDYTIAIDTNRDGTFGNASDVVDDTGDLSASGSNAYAWNGQDAAGNVPACGDYQYQIRSSLAQVHFTMSDVENSGGTQIQRLSLPNDPALGNPLAASYNNRDPYKNGYVVTDNPTPFVNDGTSGPGFNSWTGNTGNTDIIDTWTRLPDVQTTGTVRLLCADPQVTKTVDPNPVVPGEDATFRIEVKNNGPDAATNVSVTDDLPDTVQFKSASQGCSEAASVVTCGLASLAPGATHTFEIVVEVPSSLDECIENSATVTNDTPDTNPDNNTSGECFPINRRTNLSITKAASAATVPTGGQVMYTIVVKNDGPSDDPGVKVNDPLAAGLSLVAAEASQGTCTTTNNTVACDLGTLKDQGSAQVLVTVNVTATTGCIPNTARVQGAGEDPDPADNQASAQVCVQPPPEPPSTFDLEVDKRSSATRVRIGQRVTYTIVVTNNGPGAAPEAKMTDTYNARASVVSVRTSQGTCTRQIPVTCELGRIEAGASATVTVVIKPRETGTARNAASATSCCGTDSDPNNNMDTADIRVRKVTLKVSKVANRSTVQAGDTFSYRIRVRNPTKGEARNVKVCDRLPSGLAYVSAKPKAKRSQGRQRCWTVKTLRAGKSRTFTVKVRAARGASGRITNRATATSPDANRAQARDRVRVRGMATPVTG